MKSYKKTCSISSTITGLSFLSLLICFSATEAMADNTIAADIAKCVGYTLSSQQKETAALKNVSCKVEKEEINTGYMEDDFSLSGIIISLHEDRGEHIFLEGVTIHGDPLQREIFNAFSLHYTTKHPATINDLTVKPINNEKPRIRLFFATPETLSLSSLKTLGYLEAYERVLEEAIWLDGDTAPDPSEKSYVVVAFQMNREASAKSLTINFTDSPGDPKKAVGGISRNTNGWLFTALEANFAYNSGPGRFFNILEHHSSGKKRVAAVYSNQSLDRRITSALAQRGYVDRNEGELSKEETARAIHSFQKKIGLHPDGKISLSLLRLLDSPQITSATAEMQRSLIQLGYTPGTVDGIMGPRSRSALESFQNDAGLPSDGLLTAFLLCRILDTTITSDLFPGIRPKKGGGKEKTVSSYKEKMWPNRAAPF